MKKRQVSFTIKIKGLLPDLSEEELFQVIKELSSTVIGFSLEMNNVDNVVIDLDENTINIADLREVKETSQDEKVARIIDTLHKQYEKIDCVEGSNNGPGPDDTIH